MRYVSTLAAASLVALGSSAPVGQAADLQIQNLKNYNKGNDLLSDEEIRSSTPLDEVAQPEELERMRQRYQEIYPDTPNHQAPDENGRPQALGTPRQVLDPADHSPYWSTGRLSLTTERGPGHCTAQISPDASVILTAAHCVYNAKGNFWYSDFTFLRAYEGGEDAQKLGWRCASILLDYHYPAKNYAFDFAFILTGDVSETPALEIGTGIPDQAALTAVGYPANYGAGQKLYEVDGTWHSVDRGIVTMMGNPMRHGNSGGAWFSGFSRDDETANANRIVSLNSNHAGVLSTEENGPLFTEDTVNLANHVGSGQCLR